MVFYTFTISGQPYAFIFIIIAPLTTLTSEVSIGLCLLLLIDRKGGLIKLTKKLIRGEGTDEMNPPQATAPSLRTLSEGVIVSSTTLPSTNSPSSDRNRSASLHSDSSQHEFTQNENSPETDMSDLSHDSKSSNPKP